MQSTKLLLSTISLLLLCCCSHSNQPPAGREKAEAGTTKKADTQQLSDTLSKSGKYAFEFPYDHKNFKIVVTHDQRLLAIGKDGKELFEVYWYDNGPDYISDGLFRIVENEKVGYANEAGEVIIKPQYACASPFENGQAKVTYNCDLIEEGEHSRMESDSWFTIDKEGKRVGE